MTMSRTKPPAKQVARSKNSDFGRSLLRGLRQAIAYRQGKPKGRVEVYNVAPTVDVRRVRRGTGLTQAEFAGRFGFNLRLLQDWEQGRRNPDNAARSYLLVIARAPKAVENALFPKAS